MKTTEQYLALVEPQHADKPKFTATVTLFADAMARFQAFLATLPHEFDLDYAVGVQLNAVGVRVGRSRILDLPLPSPWFTWGDPVRGWGRGIWKSIYDQGQYLTALDDDTYRRLLRAKVLANVWDGSLPGLEAILSAYFDDPETKVFVQDNGLGGVGENSFTWGDPSRGWGSGFWHQAGNADLSGIASDMNITVGVSGKLPTIIDLGLLGQNLVMPKPEGVRVTYAVTSVDSAPVFGWGMNNDFGAGWSAGAWGVSPQYAIAHLPVAA